MQSGTMQNVSEHGLKNIFPIAMDNRQPFNIILGTMRSGSTLCVHILNELGIVKCAGETQVRLLDEESVQKSIKAIDTHMPTPSKAPHTDKVLHHNMIGDVNFISDRCDFIYILMRHPLIAWNSLKETSWGVMEIDFLADQYKKMLKVIQRAPEKIIYFSYYDLVNRKKQKKIFNTTISSYSLLPTTGIPEWGDTEPLIKTGTVVERTQWQDMRRTLAKHAHTLLWRKYWRIWFLYTNIRVRLFFLKRNSKRNLKGVLRKYRK